MQHKQVIAITNRKLCTRPFLEVMKDLGQEDYHTVIVREKDLTKEEYKELFEQCIKVCGKDQLTVHNFIEVARELKVPRIHLPYPVFLEHFQELDDFDVVGTSIHKVEEAIFAQERGASYVTAGHIFLTDCKKGLEPRGIAFLANVVEAVTIPVYGIGGIKEENIDQILKTGAKGGCIMSGCMR